MEPTKEVAAVGVATCATQSKWECKLWEASWDWSEECDSDGTRDSDTDIWTGGPSWLPKGKGSDENESTTDLDAKQAELDEMLQKAQLCQREDDQVLRCSVAILAQDGWSALTCRDAWCLCTCSGVPW